MHTGSDFSFLTNKSFEHFLPILMLNMANCNFLGSNAHWYRFPGFVQQFFFSRFLADFDAQYGKLGVFWVEEFIFGKKYRAPLGIRT